MISGAAEQLSKSFQRVPASWRGYAPVVAVALLGVITTALAFFGLTRWELQRVNGAFQEAARDRVLVVQREIEHTLGLVQDVGNLFAASSRVGRRQFREFVGPALKRHPSVAALAWAPKVEEARRAAFEAEARRSFARFRITERSADGESIDASSREEHFPVLYVQPYASNKAVLGYDLGSDPETLRELQEGAKTGALRLSWPPPDVWGQDSDSAIVARLPVYLEEESEGGEEARESEGPQVPGVQLLGFALGVFRIGGIVEKALENLTPSGIDLWVYGLSAEGKAELLYSHASRLGKGKSAGVLDLAATAQDPWTVATLIPVADRTWYLVCKPLPGHYLADLWSGWTVLLGGLAFTAVLAAYLATLVGRAAEVRRLVTERTVQLVEANEALNTEVTERRRAERQLQALNETLEQRVARRTAEAERRAAELEQFAYVASHDLKAPLRAISNLATWLEEDLQDRLTDETREQLELLRDRVRRMSDLIEGLLQYSRVGRTEGSRQSVDTGKLLKEVVDSLAPPRNFKIGIPEDMPTFETDRLHLGQVFANLIGNSIKHRGRKRGRVWVTVADRGPFYEFTVADDGPGIAPEYHDKVFMMFQTLSARDSGSDTGIGLALVRKIVQEHGGSITLESSEGKGAAFRFTWPREG